MKKNYRKTWLILENFWTKKIQMKQSQWLQLLKSKIWDQKQQKTLNESNNSLFQKTPKKSFKMNNPNLMMFNDQYITDDWLKIHMRRTMEDSAQIFLKELSERNFSPAILLSPQLQLNQQLPLMELPTTLPTSNQQMMKKALVKQRSLEIEH